MLALAGCAGSTGGNGTPTAGEPTGSGGGTGESGTGTVQFYVSDRPGAIDDFSHLNVTIESVAFARAGGGTGNETANGTATDANEAETPANGTATPANETAPAANGTETAENGTETESGGWITREVDGATVDLTRLQGDNATLVGSPELPVGKYTTVVLTVSDVDATLTDGSSADVKLPSGKLRLNEGFTLGANDTVSFVYDVSVVNSGNSGKYVLKPVLDQSGADVPVKAVDDHGRTKTNHGSDDRGTDRERENGHGNAKTRTTTDRSTTAGATTAG